MQLFKGMASLGWNLGSHFLSGAAKGTIALDARYLRIFLVMRITLDTDITK